MEQWAVAFSSRVGAASVVVYAVNSDGRLAVVKDGVVDDIV